MNDSDKSSFWSVAPVSNASLGTMQAILETINQLRLNANFFLLYR